MPKPQEAGLQLGALITAREDWTGNFSVNRARPRSDATARVVCGLVNSGSLVKLEVGKGTRQTSTLRISPAICWMIRIFG